MPTEFLYQQSEILIALALLGLLALAGELGYRLGFRGRQTHNELSKRLAAIVILILLPLWACASQSAGPFERAGRNADEVVEDVQEGAEDVIEGVRETAEDVGDDVRRRRR